MLLTFRATKSKPNEYKKSTKWQKMSHNPWNLFGMDFVTFKILVAYTYNQMHYMNIIKYRCMHYLSMKENWRQFHYLIHFFLFFENENVVNTRIQII